MSSLWGDTLPPEQPVEKTKPLRHMTNAQILVHRSKDNPCVRVYGAGPDGKQCKTCIHLYTQGNVQGTYYKCKKRGTPTGGPGTDHRVRWPACSKYEEKAKEQHTCHYAGNDCTGEVSHQCPRCKRWYCDEHRSWWLPLDGKTWVQTAMMCVQCYYECYGGRR